MWAEHEAWWQSGRPGLEEYSWPVPGTLAMVQEGQDAYFAYRDYLAAFVLAADGFAELLDDLRKMVADMRERFASEPDQLFATVGRHDDAFRAQWNNLFGGVLWEGVSHGSLAAYAQKYEVEWPLRILACMRGLLSAGRYDATLAQFRDQGGRLRKGVVVDYLAGGFKAYPAFRAALVRAYSAKLRNHIGHNDYVIDEVGLKAIDGSFAETRADVWGRVHALTAIQNALVWLESTRAQDPRALAPRGVLGLGWIPLSDDGVPELLVLQLSAFRQFDPDAAWLDHGVIELDRDTMKTRLGEAKAHEGTLDAALRRVLDRVRALGGVRCHVTGVMPCLHDLEDDHEVFDVGGHRYCEVDAPVSGWVAVTVVDSEGVGRAQSDTP